MNHYRDVADRYLAMWNEPDANVRAGLIAAAWSKDGRYADPLMQGEGHAGIAGLIDAARTQFPGHGFTLAGEPDGHGRFVRFSWTLAPSGGRPIARGTDVARLDEEGRLADVTGFLDGVPDHG